MPKLTTDQRLASIDEARQRWQRKLSRATNALAKLERQRKRLLAKPKGAVEIFVEMKAEADAELATSAIFPDPEPVTESVTPPADDLAIPTFLKRGLAAQTAVDKAIEEAKRKDAEAAAAIKAEAHERKLKKARGQIAKLKAKQSGETKAMPLTGKAALEAIRRGHR